MAEEGSRRVKLDLSDFVLDVGSHRWLLLVPGAMVTVGDLLTRLRGEYEQVEEGDGLTVFLDGQYMVPPWEPLAILREGDQLRITLSKAGRAGRPPAAKRRRVEEVQVKAASKRSKVEQAKAKVEEVAKSKPKKKESSSESSSEEEVTKPEVNKHEVKQVASKKPVVAKESSSSSSEEEEETKSKQQPVPKKAAAKESSSSSSSSEEEATTVEPKQQVKTVSKESSSSDSSSSEEEVKSAEVKYAEVKQVQQQKAAEASSSSDGSEAEITKAKEKPLQNGVAEAAPAPGSAPGPPKRKRKRKPRNRNKLPADQMPDFGPPIQALPEFVAKPDTSRENMHRRFGEKEEAEEEEEEDGEMSAEAMQELYKQSVAYANRGAATGAATGKLLQPSYMPALASPKPSQASPKTAQPSPKPAQPSAKLAQPSPKPAQPSPKPAQPSPKPPAKQPLARAAQPSSNGASCEEALLAAQDQRATTNGAAASRAAPRVVFRPRAIDVSKIRTEQPSPGLQLSTAGSEAAAASLLASPAAAEAKGNQEKVEESGVENGKEAAKKNGLAVEGMEALLSCRGKVFDRSVDRPMARDYSSLTPLQGPPGIGAVLAYRVMELGADYTPGMSQYKEGRVVQVSGQQVTLELQAGASTRVGGRFSMVEEEVEVERVVTLTLGELIQPLLVA